MMSIILTYACIKSILNRYQLRDVLVVIDNVTYCNCNHNTFIESPRNDAG